MGKSIEEIEQLDGRELDEWRIHFRRYPFTVDLLDFIGAHICQAIVASFGGNQHRLEKFLLIRRPVPKQTAAQAEAVFRAAFGG